MLFRLIELIAILGLFFFLQSSSVSAIVSGAGLLSSSTLSSSSHDDGDVIRLENVSLADVNTALVECTNLCVHSVNGTQWGLAGCYKSCHAENSPTTTTTANFGGLNLVQGGDFHFAAELICQTDNRATLKISSSSGDDDDRKQQQFGAPGLFVLEISAPAHLITVLATTPTISIDHLHPDTQYLLTGFVASRSTNRIEMVTDFKLTTFPADFQPESVTNVASPAFDVHGEEEENLVMTLKWNLPAQRSCFYEVLWHAVDDESHPQQKILTISASGAEEEKNGGGQILSVAQLRFGTNYKLAIRGKSTLNDALRDGPLIWLDIRTPSCLEWSGNDLDQCPPATPERLNISSVTYLTLRNHYDIKVTWKLPKVVPDNYTIQLVDMGTEDNANAHRVHSVNVTTGNATSFTFQSVALHGTHFEVVLFAHSRGGSSGEAFATKFFDAAHQWRSANERLIEDVELLILILLPVAMLLGIVLFAYRVYVKRQQLFRLEDACSYSRHTNGGQYADNLEAKLTLLRLPIDDQMELRREDIELLNNDLGEGEFGMVKLGRLRVNSRLDKRDVKEQIVAIKMLKHSPSTEEIVEFRREIDVMKSVGAHQNVISIVGHYTRNINELMLLTEYCPKGNLLNYLRRVWKMINDDACFAEDGLYSEIGHVMNAVENKAYEFTLVNPGEEEPVTHEFSPDNSITVPSQVDLLQMALQIASGMEYLSKNRVIHRDLAARNVLLCGDGTVKIADFGLSRDVYQDNVYRKTSNGKLPIKWMAIESLSHKIYTSQSDVWSYGILLYELVTFGSTPYPSVANEKVLELLTSGYRMECPVNCDEFVYDLMLACWNGCANNRPHFSSIVYQVQKMLEALQNGEPGGGGGGVDDLNGKDILTTTREEKTTSTMVRMATGFCDEMFI